jgi:hypothetical protein
MCKIIESTLVSLDGVVGDPHIWATKYFDGEAEEHALELLSSADAMLTRSRTYHFFAAAFPHRTGAYGAGRYEDPGHGRRSRDVPTSLITLMARKRPRRRQVCGL